MAHKKSPRREARALIDLQGAGFRGNHLPTGSVVVYCRCASKDKGSISEIAEKSKRYSPHEYPSCPNSQSLAGAKPMRCKPSEIDRPCRRCLPVPRAGNGNTVHTGYAKQCSSESLKRMQSPVWVNNIWSLCDAM